MRTRKSNSNKRYTVAKYDFEDSSDEEIPKRRKDADDKDENFEGDAAEESADEDDLAIEESNYGVSDPEGMPDRFARQRVRPIRPFNARAAGVAGYFDIEAVPADGRIVRAYCGPYDRSFRGNLLARAWYGRHADGMQVTLGMLDRWMDWTVLPPKVREGELEEGGRDRGVWSPGFFEREAYNSEHWYGRIKEDIPTFQNVGISPEEAQKYRFGRGAMPVLMGPYDAQKEVSFEALQSCSLAQSGLPFDQDEQADKIASGWMLDAGGIVLSLDWMPHHKTEDAPQVLAIAVIPHSDQGDYDYEEESAKPDFQKYGAVQLWEFHGERTEDGLLRPSSRPPKLRKTVCFDYGRARRVKWAPACGLLAVLCGDGSVCIVKAGDDSNGGYERVQQPLSIFQITDEENVKATTITWVNFNRLAVGYSDGSIGLWSVRPNRLLSRHPIHHSPVINMVSGYPSMPYVIASAPIGGTPKLVDLRGPSYETTEVQALTITTQPHLMAYSDHLLGFVCVYPSAGTVNTQLGFMHHTHFPITRRLYTNDSFLSSVSIGHTHPFLLVGSADGSLWSQNPQVELFSTKREPAKRIRLFQHEHRPAIFFPADSPASIRGVSRIVQGFVPERALNPKTELSKQPQKGKKKKGETNDMPAEEDEEGSAPVDPSRGIIYEPLTRITAAEWNPNEDYGCWAAAAMGSGLVRVLDLGLEVPSDKPT